MTNLKNSIDKLESEFINNLKSNSKNSSINNKKLLIEILKSGSLDRKLISIKATSLYFKKTNIECDATKYKEKEISIKNSLDTLISNFNNDDKIKNDSDLKMLKLIKIDNSFELINK